MMRNILLSSSSSVSAPNQKARMINEDAGTGVHQDLCPLSEASSALEHKISFGFALPMCTCSFGDV